VKYSGNITGGALLARESRIIARLLLDTPDHESVRARIASENLLQNNSRETTRKYCRLIFPRLESLPPEILRFVAEGTEELARLSLFAAILRTLDLVSDFVEEVLLVKVRSFEPALLRTDWNRFLEERGTVDPSVLDWSESSRKKMAQVIFRMLAEAGYLEDTRSLKILFPAVPPELVAALEAMGDKRTLNLLRLGRN
jgi:hypothetical protein